MRSRVLIGVAIMALFAEAYGARPFEWNDSGKEIIKRHGSPEEYLSKNFPDDISSVVLGGGFRRVIKGRGCDYKSISYSPWRGPLDFKSQIIEFDFDYRSCRLARVSYTYIKDASFEKKSGGDVFDLLKKSLTNKYGSPDHEDRRESSLRNQVGSLFMSELEKISESYVGVSIGWEVEKENLLIVLKAEPMGEPTWSPSINLFYIRVDRELERNEVEKDDNDL